ncbi:hypothetical protein HAX54_006130, partial [Datura stramonium]|nr:hypothetical protein [Datura stramonium]
MRLGHWYVPRYHWALCMLLDSIRHCVCFLTVLALYMLLDTTEHCMLLWNRGVELYYDIIPVFV